MTDKTETINDAYGVNRRKAAFKSTVMVTYTGDNANLVSGETYDRQQLANAFNKSYQFICARLNGAKVATDADFLGPKQPKLIPFTGTHKKLITNNSYTFKQLGEACGLSPNAMCKRLNKRPVCTTHDLRIRGAMQSNGITLSSALSAKWLRRKLT